MNFVNINTNTVVSNIGYTISPSSLSLSVSGNLRANRYVSNNLFLSNNSLNVNDGLNVGTISQVSTELTLSSSGSSVAIANSNNLIFKNDSTIQTTAYTARHKIDPVDIHGFLQNRTIIKQTCSLQNPNLSTPGVGGGNILFYNLGTLRKGQVIQGAFCHISGATTGQLGLYTQTSPSLVASTATSRALASGFNYIAFTSAYTIPTTQVYFLAVLVNGAGITGVSLNAHNYFNYGFSASTGALRVNTQYTNSTYSTLPSSLSGVAFTASNFNVFVGIYG